MSNRTLACTGPVRELMTRKVCTLFCELTTRVMLVPSFFGSISVVQRKVTCYYFFSFLVEKYGLTFRQLCYHQ